MKIFFLAVAFVASVNFACAQQVPAYGVVDAADLKITSCDFEKDAEAYKLLQTGKVTFESVRIDFRVKLEKRVRILILKENGIDFANQKIRFYSKDDYESVGGITGATYNLVDGKVVATPLESKNIYTQKLDSRISQVVFTMPMVKVGSIIEFKYTKYRSTDSNIEDWFFQDRIPTRISQYNVNIPEYFEFTTQGITTFPMKVKNSESQAAAFAGSQAQYTIYEKTYTMENIPGLRFEPYMTTPADYIQQLQFQFSAFMFEGHRKNMRNTWGKVVGQLNDDNEFGLQLKKNVSVSDTLRLNLKNARSEKEKIGLIFNYVKNNINFNGFENFWTTDGVKTTMQKHVGSSGDINLLLINLLRDEHINARPVLVSSRDNGMVNVLFPFMQQFNNVLAYVVGADSAVYVLDASGKYNSMQRVPYDYLNGKGFLVSNDHGEFVVLTSDYKYDHLVSISAEITDEGVLKGNSYIRSIDYAKTDRQKELHLSKDKTEALRSSSYALLKIDSLDITDKDEDALPLEERFNFETPLNSSGDYKYFSTNLFLNFEKNPFTADNRSTDVYFGYDQHYSLRGIFKIPENYTFEELPKSFSMKLPGDDIVIKRIIEAEDNTATVNIDIAVNKPLFSVDEYDELKEMYKKIYTLLNEQIVIKKK